MASVSILQANSLIQEGPKRRPAKPASSQNTVRILLPVNLHSYRNQELTLSAELIISLEGKLVKVRSAEFAAQDGRINLSPEDANSVAKQIFETWPFDPAGDVEQGVNANDLLEITARVKL